MSGLEERCPASHFREIEGSVRIHLRSKVLTAFPTEIRVDQPEEVLQHVGACSVRQKGALFHLEIS